MIIMLMLYSYIIFTILISFTLSYRLLNHRNNNRNHRSNSYDSIHHTRQHHMILNMIQQQKHSKFLHLEEYPNDNYNHILGINDANHIPSKLQNITTLRINDVSLSKKPIDTQGCAIDRSFYVSSEDLEEEIIEFDKKYGKPVNLANKIASVYPSLAIAAEFKRASPSKGDINMHVDVVTQCLQYADAGAAIISVLTEFPHFKGTLNDMKQVRLATQQKYGSDKRPAILRKDFILDRYQILEARANGADTVLLIVAILGVEQLTDLIMYCRKFGIEPLVEVHTTEEMNIALDCGSKVIGVNNRNLHSFQLDLQTTSKAIAIARSRNLSWKLSYSNNGVDSVALPSILIAALSGITSSADVKIFRDDGVACVLVGEALMKSGDPVRAINNLLADDSHSNQRITDTSSSSSAYATSNGNTLIKICGLKDVNDAKVALQTGANMLGVIFAASPRQATVQQAIEVVEIARQYGERSDVLPLMSELDKFRTTSSSINSKDWFTHFASLLKTIAVRRPIVVGVFQNQTPEDINRVVLATGVDIVQLHGNESHDVIDKIIVPCIKVLHIDPKATSMREIYVDVKQQIEKFKGKAIALLLDSRLSGSAGGGTGVTFDWSVTDKLDGIPVILSGGLTVHNVEEGTKTVNVIGVDVSSSVETSPGVKDIELLKEFIANAKLHTPISK